MKTPQYDKDAAKSVQSMRRIAYNYLHLTLKGSSGEFGKPSSLEGILDDFYIFSDIARKNARSTDMEIEKILIEKKHQISDSLEDENDQKKSEKQQSDMVREVVKALHLLADAPEHALNKEILANALEILRIQNQNYYQTLQMPCSEEEVEAGSLLRPTKWREVASRINRPPQLSSLSRKPLTEQELIDTWNILSEGHEYTKQKALVTDYLRTAIDEILQLCHDRPPPSREGKGRTP